MASTPRIAVLGPYRSGTSLVAGVLHRLGVNMGPPFWMKDDENSSECFYESRAVGHKLQRWWHEPKIRERTSQEVRIEFLSQWIAKQEAKMRPVGLKHPLLSLWIRPAQSLG